MSEASKWDGNPGIAVNAALIEVTKTEEGLDVLNFPRDGLVRNGGDLVQSHAETVRQQNVAKVLASGDTELTLG